MTETPFLEIVQTHERNWGTDTYPGRPTLAELLSAPIVALWAAVEPKDRRQIATIYHDLDELERYVTRIVLHSKLELPKYRLTAVYINQKKAAIRGVRLEIIPQG